MDTCKPTIMFMLFFLLTSTQPLRKITTSRFLQKTI